VKKAEHVTDMERKETFTKFSLENLKEGVLGRLTFRWQSDIRLVLREIKVPR
jgi:hypothetical protein